MAARGVEVVTRVRPGLSLGRHGTRGAEEREEITGCHVIPRTSTEADGRANTVVVGMSLVAPGGTDLQATDRIEWLGRAYEIEGEPADYRKGGRSKAVIAALKRVTG